MELPCAVVVRDLADFGPAFGPSPFWNSGAETASVATLADLRAGLPIGEAVHLPELRGPLRQAFPARVVDLLLLSVAGSAAKGDEKNA